ncbi:MAG: nitrous oxide reductase family maturation protein NosD [Chloroflexi bacterium]|nr:nitrous oxide reductase family maturation protein NosD [Chloroflexota bacterium]
MRRRNWMFLGIALLLWASGATPLLAQEGPATLVVSPQGPYRTIAEALAEARDGDTIEVREGIYSGPLVVDRSVKIIGYGWPVIDGGGQGTVVRLTARGAMLKGFVVQNSGDALDQENSGIAVEAPEVVVEGNRLEGTLFGIYLRKAVGSVIRGNTIYSKDLPLPRRGDPIRVWYSNDVRVEDNVVEQGRDVVLWYSERLTVRGNVIQGGRYGLHFMYCDDALIEGNRLSNNSVGAFLMYSRRLHLRRNTFAYNRGPSGFGIGLKDMDDAVIEENLFLDNRVGAFVDNSPREIDSTVLFRGNIFAFNDVGILFQPSVRRNRLTENGFIENREQVGVSGGGQLQGNIWTVNGLGNYWSDYTGYDADQDGIGDLPYRATRLFENLMDRYPMLRLFDYSPATQALDFAARAFPLIKPQPKLVDDRPLMAPRIPEGLPAIPQQAARQLGVPSIGLLALAAMLIFLTQVPIRRQGGGKRLSNNEGELMIHVRDLTKRFGSLVAVDRLSFDVEAGQAVALWGANGAGKTTALRCLLGLLPFQGTVHVAGHDVRREGKAARRQMGFVPQELSFYDDMTVWETMRFYAYLKGASPESIERSLQEMGLTSVVHQAVQTLSGGMKQRLALAAALLADPPLLVLDEPTTNLDARAREDILALLAEVKKKGKTLIFSSHRLDEVVNLADRVLLMENGRIVADCSPDELDAHLGRHTELRLHVPAEQVEAAIALLKGQGFAASRNGAGVRVPVALREKGKPISLLAQAGIPVEDFDVHSLQERI